MKRQTRLLVIVILLLTAVLTAGIIYFFSSGPSESDSDSGSVLTAKNLRPPSEITDTHDFFVYFINTGRSDSILIGIDGKHYLIDTGEDTSVPAIEKALETFGVTRLEGVFLTHTHSDHIGGLPEISEKYQIDRLYTAEITERTKKGKSKLEELAAECGLTEVHTKLNRGDAVVIADNVVFNILGPIELNTGDDNDNSLVMMLRVNGRKLLFAGDMQFAEEISLMDAFADADANAGIDLRADVLKVGNHGNPDATSDSFAKAVSPAVSVITTDTSADKDSANKRVKKALTGSAIYVTQNFTGGIKLTITSTGEMIIE